MSSHTPPLYLGLQFIDNYSFTMTVNKKTNTVKGLEMKLNNLEAQILALSKGKQVAITTIEDDLEYWVNTTILRRKS